MHSLDTLPRVLDDLIIRYCDFKTQLSLSRVNRYFQLHIIKQGKYLTYAVHLRLEHFRIDPKRFSALLREHNGYVPPTITGTLLENIGFFEVCTSKRLDFMHELLTASGYKQSRYQAATPQGLTERVSFVHPGTKEEERLMEEGRFKEEGRPTRCVNIVRCNPQDFFFCKAVGLGYDGRRTGIDLHEMFRYSALQCFQL
jgi:hypothetical protein